MMRKVMTLFFCLATLASVGQSALFNQDITYSRQDSLRGGITSARAWWDLKFYDLSVTVDVENKALKGTNIITYEVLETSDQLQIDLQAPMKIVSVKQDEQLLEVTDEGNAHFVQLQKEQKKGDRVQLEVTFEGAPRVAANAPWDGGFTWTKDSNGLPFVANSNQGIGASIWWPCKDHGYDEPDEGLRLSITVPKELVAVGNGRLTKTTESGEEKTFVWEVKNPINNYGVNVNIGDYVNYSEVFRGEKGDLDLEYWVLRENLEKAKEQFKQVPMTIEAFEYWFGPYPFYEDSYKLVEVPYLGMEHQSSVTYGNRFRNGYNGRGRGSFDWSGTGIGLKWDYIIIHETGHEWFANNITAKDVADLWVHEGFTAYSESLYTEYHFGKEQGAAYSRGTRRAVSNQLPIIGDYGVNKEGSGDMYFKGNNILHTLRQIIDDDEKWRSILRGLNEVFYHSTVTTQEIENYIEKEAGLDLKPFFNQYLRNASIPRLEFEINDGSIRYRWSKVIEDFEMPLDVMIDGNATRLTISDQWKQVDGKELQIDPDFYVEVSEVSSD